MARPELIARPIYIGVDDFDLSAAEHSAQRRTGRSAEMEIPRHQRLGRDTAAGSNHLHREALFAMIALLDGDKLVHITTGDGGDGKADLVLRRRERLALLTGPRRVRRRARITVLVKSFEIEEQGRV